VDAEQGRNGFVPLFFPWDAHPERDEVWKEAQLKALGEVKFNQEVLCVGKDTIVTIRNKTTGIIETVTIEQLYQRLE